MSTTRCSKEGCDRCDHATVCVRCGDRLCTPHESGFAVIAGHFVRDNIVCCCGCWERERHEAHPKA